MSNQRATGNSINFLDVQLIGPVGTYPYGFGPGAVQLGSATLLPDDRTAALALGFASIVLQDVTPLLGPHIDERRLAHPTPNVVTACVRLRGRQLIKDFEAVPAETALDRCGFARFRLGSVRLTVRDSDAATAAADGLAAAYEVAQGSFGQLPDLGQLREARDARRNARVNRRPFRISTPNAGLLAPARPLVDRQRNEHVL